MVADGRRKEMNKRAAVSNKSRGIRLARYVALVWVVASWISSAQASTAVPASVVADMGRTAPRDHNGASLEARVKRLAQALDLNAVQQSELTQLLEGQRDQLRRVWNETSWPAAYRISATQAITDNVLNQIKALLDDDQRKKFNLLRPAREAMAGSTNLNVDALMNASLTK
jgi:Spy/CpxP family protein refolding chaperone